MRAPQVLRNAVTSAAGAVATGLALLALYRYLVHAIGIERFGVWSLVASTTSVVHFGNPGLSAGVVKHVAGSVARDEPDQGAAVIESAVLAQAAIILVVVVAAYPVIGWLLAAAVPARYLPEARAVLPVALAAFWVAMLAEVLVSALEGLQRFAWRSLAEVSAALVGAGVTILLVGRWGFVGLAWGQVAQASYLLGVCWLLLRRAAPALPPVPWRWSRARVAALVRYGLTVQAGSTAFAIFEPLIKWLMGVFGGVAMTGYFEIASRTIGRVRSLLLAGLQVLVPVVAQLSERDPARAARAYLRALQLVLFLAIPTYAGALVALPLVSRVVLGRVEPTFLLFAALLVAVAFLSTLALPAYFAYLGLGRLRWNAAAGFVVPAVALLVGWPAGRWLGGAGVALAYAVALVVGNTIIVLAFHVEEAVLLRELQLRANALLLAACILAAAVSAGAYAWLRPVAGEGAAAVVAPLAFCLLVLPALWGHPMRHVLGAWVAARAEAAG